MNDERVSAFNDGVTTKRHQSMEKTLAEIILGVFDQVLRRKVLFFIIGALTFALSASVSYLIPDYYVAHASILPASNGSSLTSIMSQFGSLPMMSGMGIGSGATRLYPSIAKSNHVIGQVLKTDFEGQTVLTFLNGGVEADSLALFDAIGLMKGNITTNVSMRNEIVTIEYGHQNKYFAAFVVNSIVSSMESFLKNNSHDDISIQLETIEFRLNEVEQDMTIAETKLLQFWQKNRAIEQSPALRITEKSLIREQQIITSLYLELVRQQELMKTQASGTASALKVLDRAEVPMIRSSPQRVKIVVISLILTFLLTLAYINLSGKKGDQSPLSAQG